MTRTSVLVPTLVLIVTALTQMAPAPAAPLPAASLPLSFVADLPLPGHPSRFDYQWVDAAHRRLYIAHLGDSSLLVFDLDGQRVIGEVPHLPSIHGVVAAPTQRLVLATATAEKTLALIDDTTLQVKSRVPAGEYPNGLAFDPASEKVFVSNNQGRGVAVVDLKTARALPGIDIGGGAGMVPQPIGDAAPRADVVDYFPPCSASVFSSCAALRLSTLPASEISIS